MVTFDDLWNAPASTEPIPEATAPAPIDPFAQLQAPAPSLAPVAAPAPLPAPTTASSSLTFDDLWNTPIKEEPEPIGAGPVNIPVGQMDFEDEPVEPVAGGGIDPVSFESQTPSQPLSQPQVPELKPEEPFADAAYSVNLPKDVSKPAEVVRGDVDYITIAKSIKDLPTEEQEIKISEYPIVDQSSIKEKISMLNSASPMWGEAIRTGASIGETILKPKDWKKSIQAQAPRQGEYADKYSNGKKISELLNLKPADVTYGKDNEPKLSERITTLLDASGDGGATMTDDLNHFLREDKKGNRQGVLKGYEERYKKGEQLAKEYGIVLEGMEFDSDGNPIYSENNFPESESIPSDAETTQAINTYLREVGAKGAREKYDRESVTSHLLKVAEVLDPAELRSYNIEQDMKALQKSDNKTYQAWEQGRIGFVLSKHIAERVLADDEEGAKQAIELKGRFEALMGAQTLDEKGLGKLYADTVRMLSPMVLTGVKSAVPILGTAWSLNEWAKQGAGDTYADMIDAGVSHETAKQIAPVTGIIYASIERLQLGQLANVGSKLTEGMVREGLKKTLVKLAKEKGKDFIKEVSEEGVQRIITDLGTELGMQAEGLSEKDLGEIVWGEMKNMGEEMSSAAPQMLILSALGLGAGSVKAARRAKVGKKEVAPEIAPEEKVDPTKAVLPGPKEAEKIVPAEEKKPLSDQDVFDLAQAAQKGDIEAQKRLDETQSIPVTKQVEAKPEAEVELDEANVFLLPADDRAKAFEDMDDDQAAEAMKSFQNLPETQREEIFPTLSEEEQDIVTNLYQVAEDETEGVELTGEVAEMPEGLNESDKRAEVVNAQISKAEKVAPGISVEVNADQNNAQADLKMSPDGKPIVDENRGLEEVALEIEGMPSIVRLKEEGVDVSDVVVEMADVAGRHPISGLDGQLHWVSEQRKHEANNNRDEDGNHVVYGSYDFNDFKILNDAWGQEFGDKIAKSMMKHFHSELEKRGHHGFHVGGDENRPTFRIPPNNIEKFNKDMAEIHEATNSITLTTPDGKEIPFGVSMAIAEDFPTADLLLKSSKKSVGKNSFVIDKKLKKSYSNIQDVIGTPKTEELIRIANEGRSEDEQVAKRKDILRRKNVQERRGPDQGEGTSDAERKVPEKERKVGEERRTKEIHEFGATNIIAEKYTGGRAISFTKEYQALNREAKYDAAQLERVAQSDNMAKLEKKGLKDSDAYVRSKALHTALRAELSKYRDSSTRNVEAEKNRLAKWAATGKPTDFPTLQKEFETVIASLDSQDLSDLYDIPKSQIRAAISAIKKGKEGSSYARKLRSEIGEQVLINMNLSAKERYDVAKDIQGKAEEKRSPKKVEADTADSGFDFGANIGEDVDEVDLMFARRTNPDEYIGVIKEKMAKPQPKEKDLVAMHNLDENSIVFIDEVGGIPLPSLAIVQKDIGFEGFGEISLIADKSMVDPEFVKVFDADIYSPRSPKIEYKLNNKESNDFSLKLSEARLKYEMTTGESSLEEHIRNSDKKMFLRSVGYDESFRGMFLEDNNVSVRVATSPAHLRGFLTGMPSIVSYIKNLVKTEKVDSSNEDRIRKELYDVAVKATEEYADDRVKTLMESGETRERVLEANRKHYLKLAQDMLNRDSLDGIVYYNFLAEALDDYKTISQKKKTLDRRKTVDRIDRAVKKLGKDKFEEWALDIADKIFVEPHYKKGRKKVDFSLNSAIDIMLGQAITGSENTMTTSVAKARSRGAKRFKNLDEMRKAKERIVESKAFDKLKDASNDRFFDLSDKVKENYKYYHKDSFSTYHLDDLSKSIYDYYTGSGKGRSAMERSLKKNDFSNISDSDIDDIVSFATDLQNMPTEYFEAKIQRGVRLSEFSGAVIPKGTSQKVKDILAMNDVPFVQYDSRKDGDRTKKVQKISKAADVFFKKDLLEDSTGDLFEGTEYGDERSKTQKEVDQYLKDNKGGTANISGLPLFEGGAGIVDGAEQVSLFRKSFPAGDVTYINDTYEKSVSIIPKSEFGRIRVKFADQFEAVVRDENGKLTKKTFKLGKDNKAAVLMPKTGPITIYLSNKLSAEEVARYYAHEVSHIGLKNLLKTSPKHKAKMEKAFKAAKNTRVMKQVLKAYSDKTVHFEEFWVKSIEDALASPDKKGLSKTILDIWYDFLNSIGVDIKDSEQMTRLIIKEMQKAGVEKSATEVARENDVRLAKNDAVRIATILPPADFEELSSIPIRHGSSVEFRESLVAKYGTRSTFRKKATQAELAKLDDMAEKENTPDHLNQYLKEKSDWRKKVEKWESEYPADKPINIAGDSYYNIITPRNDGDGWRVTNILKEDMMPSGHQNYATRLEALKETLKPSRVPVNTLFAVVPQVDSKAFKNWFGDSKVVDENGEPVVVYHGTGTTITEFGEGFTGQGNNQLGSGFYFTTKKSEAEGYQTGKLQDPRTGKLMDKPGGEDSPNVMDAFLSIQKPIIVSGSNLRESDVDLTQEDAAALLRMAPDIMHKEESPLGDWHEEYWDEGPQDWMIDQVAENYTGASLMSLEGDFFGDDSTEFREAVNKVLGYDGVVMDFGDDHKHYVAWFPTQIKSATDNVGTFEETNPDIRFAEREKVDPFFSPTEQKISELKQEKGVVAQIKSMIKKEQLKKAEIEWMGLNEWLDENPKATKTEVLDFVKSNQVTVEETVLDEGLTTMPTLESVTDDLYKEALSPGLADGEYWFDEMQSQKMKVADDIRESVIEKESDDGETVWTLKHNNVTRNVDDDPLDMDSDELVELFDISDEDIFELIPKDVIEQGARYIAENEAPDILESRREEFRENREEGLTEHGSYVLPGGTNYKEVLFRMPITTKPLPADVRVVMNSDNDRYYVLAKNHVALGTGVTKEEALENARENHKETAYKSGHWEQPNVFAHARLNDRVTPDGERVLFIEEIQSDWARDIRKRGVQKDLEKLLDKEEKELRELNRRTWDGPELSKEEKEHQKILKDKVGKSLQEKSLDAKGIKPFPHRRAWHEYVLKNILRKAADEGYDRVAWINGKQTADRYSLEKKIDHVRVNPKEGGRDVYILMDNNSDFSFSLDKDGKITESSMVGSTVGRTIDQVVGKKIAKKIMDAKGESKLEGEDLKMGGEWAVNLYDKTIPNFLNKYAKKWGNKVEDVMLGNTDQQSISLSGNMAYDLQYAGQPMFAKTSDDQTETPAFKKWFKDSKVVNKSGEPVVVYHGTGNGITEFSLAKAKDLEGRRRGLGLGARKFYFTGSEKSASLFAEGAPNRKLGKTPNVMPVYLSVENPISEKLYKERFKDLTGKEMFDPDLTRQERDKAIKSLDTQIKKDGFDGIVEEFPDGTFGQIAVFESNQIKSATGNIGTFDAESPDIRFAKIADDKDGEKKTSRKKAVPKPIPTISQVDKIEKAARSLRSKLRYVSDEVLGQRAEMEVEMLNYSADLQEKLTNMIYDYAKKIGLRGEPRNRVDTLMKNVKTVSAFRKALETMDVVLYKRQNSVLKKQVMKRIMAERMRLKRLEGKTRQSRTDLNSNRKLKAYLMALTDATPKDLDNVEKTLNWYIENPNRAMDSAIANDLRKTFKATLNDMDNDQLRQVVKNINEIKIDGYTKKQREETEKQEMLAEDAEKAVKEIEAITDPPEYKSGFKKSVEGRKRRNWLKKFAWDHVRPERMNDLLVGYNEDSVFKRNVFDKILEAEEAQLVNTEVAVKEFQKIHAGIDVAKALSEPYMELTYETVDDTGKGLKEKIQLTLNQMMFIYANSKNPGNRSHLYGSGIYDSVIEEVLDKLPAKHRKSVDDMIDYFDNTQYDRVGAVFAREHDVDMPKEHNYFPISNLQTDRAENAVAADLLARFTSRQASIKKGMTKSRVNSKAAFAELDYFGTTVKSIRQSEHYIAYNDIVRDVNQFLNKTEVKKAMDDRNTEYSLQLNDWLRAAAYGRIGASENVLDQASDWLRNKYMTYALGFNLITVAKQPASFFQGSKEVNKGALAHSIRKYATGRSAQEAFVKEKSVMMRNRATSYEREMAEMAEKKLIPEALGISKSELKQMKQDGTPINEKTLLQRTKMAKDKAVDALEKVREFSMSFITKADMMTTTILWYGKYHEVMAKSGNEKTAIKAANSVIRRTQPMGGLVHLPAIYRGNGLARAYTVFTNQLNQDANMLIDYKQTTGKRDIGQNLLHASLLALLPATYMYWISSALRPPWEDPEGFAKFFVSQFTGGFAIGNRMVDSVMMGITNATIKARGGKVDYGSAEMLLNLLPPSLGPVEDAALSIAQHNPKKAFRSFMKISGQGYPAVKKLIVGGMRVSKVYTKEGEKLSTWEKIKEHRALVYSKYVMDKDPSIAGAMKKRLERSTKWEDRVAFKEWYKKLSPEKRLKFRKEYGLKEFAKDYTKINKYLSKNLGQGKTKSGKSVKTNFQVRLSNAQKKRKSGEYTLKEYQDKRKEILEDQKKFVKKMRKGK